MGKNTTITILAMVTVCWSFLVTANQKLDAEVAKYLEFEEVGDGKCHILSEGGKLLVMHNRHPDKAINYRLIRFFADVRQWGRATGTASPTDGPVKLGCTQVDGRQQRWEIERAHYDNEAK